MLTLLDCMAFAGVTPEQLEAIACHEHMSEIVAAEWANCMINSPEGCELIRAMLADEVSIARAHGEENSAARYQHALDEFLDNHPAGNA